ncbi:hypothetical protein [Neisseria dentiae]|nr:hypothetical protein [Neisseria dentiae]STZ49883.1 Uncharacterised protein [Neisseria dentiae]STZ49927.1 Uncharacterised protein [Neisseria dentiae]
MMNVVFTLVLTAVIAAAIFGITALVGAYFDYRGDFKDYEKWQ